MTERERSCVLIQIPKHLQQFKVFFQIRFNVMPLVLTLSLKVPDGNCALSALSQTCISSKPMMMGEAGTLHRPA